MLRSMSMVPRARWVHHARASAPPNAWGRSAATRAASRARILSGRLVVTRRPSRTGGAEHRVGQPPCVAGGEHRRQLQHLFELAAAGGAVGPADAGFDPDLELVAGAADDAVQRLDRRHLPPGLV